MGEGNPFRLVAAWARVPQEPAPAQALCCDAASRFVSWGIKEISQLPTSGANAEAVFNASLVRITRQFWAERWGASFEHRDRLTNVYGDLCLYGVFVKIVDAWHEAFMHVVPPKLLSSVDQLPTAALLEKMLPMMVMGLPYDESAEEPE